MNLKQPSKGFLESLGPGLITGAADDDPSVRDGPTNRRVQLTTNPPDLYR
jgi:hypothetical protein